MIKTPISYYGGKQNLLPELLPIIPDHYQYVEPFCGGAALFWAKKPSISEAINDFDGMLINFWRVIQNNFDELNEMIQATLHHELLHQKAKEILQNEMGNPIEYAWAYWVQTQMSFSYRLFGGFRFASSPGGGEARNTHSKKLKFKEQYSERLKNVEIFNRDAIELISTKDHPDSFMYFDPPYAESNCGHYESGKNVYYALLDLLPSLKCKWLMSSYPSEQLTDIRLKMGYNSKEIEQALSVSGKHNEGKTKIECLTWNYKIPKKQLSIF